MNGETRASLIDLLQAGDPEAARQIFDRYCVRLTSLARRRMSPALGRRIDAEDLVQSAYRSFFSAACHGRLRGSNDETLWPLLVAITIRKLQKRVRWHRQLRRSLTRESAGPNAVEWVEIAAREPSPEEAAQLADELSWLFRQLKPIVGRILEMRLQGFSLAEIAATTGRTIRTVSRALDQARSVLLRSAVDDSEAPIPSGTGEA